MSLHLSSFFSKVYLFIFFETVSLCSRGCPGAHGGHSIVSVTESQLSASVSWVLGLKMCTAFSFSSQDFIHVCLCVCVCMCLSICVSVCKYLTPAISLTPAVVVFIVETDVLSSLFLCVWCGIRYSCMHMCMLMFVNVHTHAYTRVCTCSYLYLCMWRLRRASNALSGLSPCRAPLSQGLSLKLELAGFVCVVF